MPEKPSQTDRFQKAQRELEDLSDLQQQLSAVEPGRVEAMQDWLRVLRELLDSFNEIFGPLGWVAYNGLNLEVARQALEVASAEGTKAAEKILAGHYNAVQVGRELLMLSSVKSFGERMCLAKLALVDYQEGRYHASVPVVLALLDGMVNQLGSGGFFKKNIELSAWDTVAACESGLAALQKLFSETRPSTCEPTIEVPYRNGILHGMDLGYDNQLVAAKSWAALFATADWVRQIERGLKVERAVPPLHSKGTTAHQEALAPEDPVSALDEFLCGWRDRKYDFMVKRGYIDRGSQTLKRLAGQVAKDHAQVPLESFAIHEADHVSCWETMIRVHGRGMRFGAAFDRDGTFRMVYLDPNQNAIPRDSPGGRWFVTTWDPWTET